MKKRILFTGVLVALAMTLLACNGKKQEKTADTVKETMTIQNGVGEGKGQAGASVQEISSGTEKKLLKSKQRVNAKGEVRETENYEYDSQGRMTVLETDNYNSSTNKKVTFEYKDGLLNAMTRTDTYGNVIIVSQYEYEDGRLISRKDYNMNDTMVSYTDYAYNENGDLKSEKQYTTAGYPIESKKYEYDIDGTIKSCEEVKGDGAVKTIHEYEYDTEGRIKAITTYDAAMKLMGVDRYRYDAGGNCLSITSRDEEDNIYQTFNYIY